MLLQAAAVNYNMPKNVLRPPSRPGPVLFGKVTVVIFSHPAVALRLSRQGFVEVSPATQH